MDALPVSVQITVLLVLGSLGGELDVYRDRSLAVRADSSIDLA
jgi:hypothetical protein